MADMPRCRDCYWWDANEPARLGESQRGMCSRLEAIPDLDGVTITVCTVGGGYLNTFADFGCVEWNAKPDA